MEADILNWLFNQSAALVAFALVAYFNKRQVEHLAENQERILTECWSKILSLLDGRD